MLRVYTCIVVEHDLRLVALAALVCALASYTAVSLLHHVGRSDARMRRFWLAVAAVATGFGIWATHFIAMLAFQPAIPSGYNVALTLLSLVEAVLLTGTGLAVGLARDSVRGHWLGGAIIGAGIATMHYTGMAAFEIEGRIVWDPALVVVSIGLGGLLGAAALQVTLRGDTMKWKLLGALVLTLAICSHHFTAMGAAAIMPDPRVAVPVNAVPAAWMAIGVAMAAGTILFLAFAGLLADLRDLRRAGETQRMRELTDAAVEGLVVCDDAGLVTANQSFATLVGVDAADLVGVPISFFFPDTACSALDGTAYRPWQTTLRTAFGDWIPVEVIQRSIIYAGRPHKAIAIRDVSERKQAEEEIYFLAHHDPLTKLPNRTAFNDRLESELAVHRGTDECLAVLFLDLDRFKEINDLFGHSAGDAVLQFVAETIGSVLQPGEMAARLGGDEFAVIVPRLPNPAYANRVAEALLKAFKTRSETQRAGAKAGTSIGIALYPQDASDRTTLLGHADAALYRAKAEGRGTYKLFEASMAAHIRDKRDLQHDIGKALSRNEFSLVYQPQAHLASSEVFGFEALLRWQHPAKGAIPPSAFIPVAEECGAILAIGEWVLRSACAEAARWRQPLAIAVNISAVQLHGPDLPALVRTILSETGLDPVRLELEITETALIKDISRALEVLQRLKALGVRISIDDFGTGYSSLSHVRAFKFDKIKIDQSFVRSVETSAESAAIVRAVVGLAQGLNLPVLAEGVETAEELSFLRKHACDELQGYLLARPAPIGEFEKHTMGVAPAARRLQVVASEVA